MTEQTQPTDAEIETIWSAVSTSSIWPEYGDLLAFARAVLAKWGTPAGPETLGVYCGITSDDVTDPTHPRYVAGFRVVHAAGKKRASNGQAPAGATAAPVTLWGHAFEYVDKNLLPHSDDVAVDRFAVVMKEKLAAARAKGCAGWDSPECTQQRLSDMLRDHVGKGDPRDVANFCMFLWCRGEDIAQPAPTAQVAPAAGSQGD